MPSYSLNSNIDFYRSPKILIVDDDHEIALRMRDMLVYGFSALVHVVSNGKEAINKMIQKKGEYDLVILEILTPKLNGIEVCEMMISNSLLCNIPVLLISILPLRSEPFQKSLKFYKQFTMVKDVLEKPFSRQAFLIKTGILLENTIKIKNVIQTIKN